jgi:hypothetical protein
MERSCLRNDEERFRVIMVFELLIGLVAEFLRDREEKKGKEEGEVEA